MSRIAEQQNTPENIRLLVAQAELYSEAKRIRLLRLGVSILLAVTAPIVALFVPHSDQGMAAIGFLWGLLTYFPFRWVQLAKTRQAATVQEQLDTTLFDLPWNNVLAGSRVKPELIYQADRASKEDRSRFRDWYSNPGSLPYPLDVLLCQRASTVWDWRLRRHYAGRVAWIIAGIILADAAIALFLHLSFAGFLLSLLIPTAPALQQLGETYLAHRESAGEKEELAHRIEDLWEVALREPEAVTRDQCRQIQDRIYSLRKDGPLVPDRWYKWLKKSYQADMDATAEELRTQAEKTLRNK
jgi:hypothetical protein